MTGLIVVFCSSGCKFYRNDIYIQVMGYSQDTPISFGTLQKARTGYVDTFISQMNTADGKVWKLDTVGKSGESHDAWGSLSNVADTIRTYIVNMVKGTGTIAFPNGQFGDPVNMTCTSGQCCYVAQLKTGNFEWVRTLDDDQYFMTCRGGVAASADGTRLFAAGSKRITMFDTSGNAIYTIDGLGDIITFKGVTMIGTDLFVIGDAVAGGNSISLNGTDINDPPFTGNSDKYGFIYKVSTTSSSMSVVGGTWIGSVEYSAVLWSIKPAYGITGYTKALVIAVELDGSELKTGTNFTSKAFSTVPCSDTADYTVCCQNWSVGVSKN